MSASSTSRPHRWQTDPTRCPVNWVVLDSDREAEYCREPQSHPVDDGHDDLLHLVIESKGYRRADAKEKKATMDTYWVPGGKTSARWAVGPSPS